ncbi:DUF2497 domain-containing protein [Phyllobacterium sp. 628]|uniref:PopZ family protein n=1 Tax=Phyllobacterium sp. 628 TaxID=2718938 RepID=UPI0016625650|nr:DUF2497 domain-containing protein [Phyllobacterium sp. 628]QND53185.1 DUF2497 domain-containing protein [Phyllobacterium sp. 628]
MAQSSSVAREPSMEEILASIRRIIEESDTTRTDDVLPTPVNSDIPVHTPAASMPVQTFDAYEDEEELAPREGIAVSHATPQSYEAPLNRPASPLQSKLVEREPVEDEVVFQPETAKAPVLTAAELRGPVDYGVREPEVFEAPEVAVEAPVAATAPAPEPVHETVEASHEPSESSIGDEVSLDLERALEPILSEATERQVSAAFGDLSFAVQNEQRRSFDDIAQEIMRPLLQDWLDNNLPNLVERLVREEIERVARGGKR